MIIHIQGPYFNTIKINMKIMTFGFYYLLLITMHDNKVIRSVVIKYILCQRD